MRQKQLKVLKDRKQRRVINDIISHSKTTKLQSSGKKTYLER